MKRLRPLNGTAVVLFMALKPPSIYRRRLFGFLLGEFRKQILYESNHLFDDLLQLGHEVFHCVTPLSFVFDYIIAHDSGKARYMNKYLIFIYDKVNIS